MSFMKNIVRIFSLVFLIASCDVIDGDVIENDLPENPGDTSNNDTTALSFARVVLVEEYTGHKCGNCPSGARTVANLKKQAAYEGRIVAISVHAGGLANWAPPGAPKFTTNFTTPVGDDLDAEYGVSLTGIPRGLVSRTEYNGSRLILPGTFEQVIQDLIAGPDAPVALSGTVSYDEVENRIAANVTAHFNEEVSEDLNVSLYVTEDSIIDWQKNYANGGDPAYPAGDVENYVHMHALRGSMNGTWGDLLNSSSGATIEADSEIPKSYSYQLEAGNVPKNCNVVAFVYRVSDDEILQVREWHLRDIID
jgi:hypothetical protein